MKHRTENAALLAAVLSARQHTGRNVADDVLTLQRAARIIHRLDERACCEDLTCQDCAGNGTSDSEFNIGPECKACAGTGRTTGKREAREAGKARAIAAAYGMRLYEQGDCRGWPLYLIPSEMFPASEDGSRYDRGYAVCPA